MGLQERLFRRFQKQEKPEEKPEDTQSLDQTLEQKNPGRIQSLLSKLPKPGTLKDTLVRLRNPEPSNTDKIRSKITGILSKFQKSTTKQDTPKRSENSAASNPGKIRTLLEKLQKNISPNDIQKIDQSLDQMNRGRIKEIFHKLLQNTKPEDIQKIDKNLERMNRGAIKEIWPKIQALAKMVRDPNAPWKGKALAIAALIYLISPFDAVPDVIPVAGLADDAALIIAVVSTLAQELENYMERQAEKMAEIQVRKYNRIVRISLLGSIAAAIIAILVKYILSQTS
ncbi:YkvA family protein [Moorena producens]|uniref:YkvA family protein n=1 Tax=Moorena producens TaxID=1155739 RepID=UPI003C741497